MKQTVKQIVTLTLALLCIVSLAACQKNTVDAAGLWENATHRGDREFGKGEKTITVEVKVAREQITFTIHTDKSTVGEALIEHGLIEGENGPYGLYIKKVNGITADYDVDQSYWAFYINGELAMTGVDMTEITGGAVYRLEYTK